jgi:hypothetical protein
LAAADAVLLLFDLSAGWTAEDEALRALAPEGSVLLVAGNRLGVLNHVLLTVQAIEQAALSLSAIVLTTLNDHDATVAEATNYDVLHQLLPGYPLFRFPWVDRVDEFDALALAAKVAGLDALAAPRAGAARGAANGVRS